MQKKRHLWTSFFIMSIAALIGCTQLRLVDNFVPYNLDAEYQTGKYVPKVDNAAIILDASESMDWAYRGDVNTGHSKFVVAKDILMRMNNTMPEMKIKCALVTFGHEIFKPLEKTDIVHGLTTYSRVVLEDALYSLISPKGNSPAGVAIEDVGDILKNTKGNNAIIFVSDGQELSNDPIMKVRNLKNMFGDRMCFYTIWVGNYSKGKNVMQSLSQEIKCGFSVTVDDIASDKDMADFVREVFLTDRKELDSDGDGVNDDDDECPDTPKGAIVDYRGCWNVKGVKFEYKKWDIKPEFNSNLDNIVNILKKNTSLKIRIEGHTDNIGSMEYNLYLSKERAKAVKNYLVKMGINGPRITTTGFGYSQPIATNNTAEGRSLNRRAEIIPIK